MESPETNIDARRTAPVESLTSEDGLREAKALDDLAFGEHQGISLEALREITEHGDVVGLRSPEGHLVAEGQVILEPIPSAEERLVRELPPDYGYFEGFATDPQRQGEGLGRQIIEAVEGRARSQGKQGLLATVRAENGPSIGALLGQGYSIVDYDPAYYEGEGGARLIVGKRLDQERSVLPADQLEHAAMADDSDSLKSAVDHGNELVAIPVENGDDVDSTSQELIATALENGYVGTTIRKPSRWTSDPGETRHLLVFEKVER